MNSTGQWGSHVLPFITWRQAYKHSSTGQWGTHALYTNNINRIIFKYQICLPRFRKNLLDLRSRKNVHQPRGEILYVSRTVGIYLSGMWLVFEQELSWWTAISRSWSCSLMVYWECLIGRRMKYGLCKAYWVSWGRRIKYWLWKVYWVSWGRRVKYWLWKVY